MKADAKGASGQSRQGIGKGTGVDNHDGAADLIVAALYVAHRQALEVYLRRFVNEHDAQDIVHEVFMNLLRSRPTWITSQDARRFLFVSCRNRARDVHRRLRWCECRDPVEFDSMQSNPAALGIGSDGILDLHQDCLHGFHESNLQRVLTMRLGGMRLSEIAISEGVSLATVKRRIRHIRRILGRFRKN
jgi:RNA polymerase sigma factor (sigma-70 family)